MIQLMRAALFVLLAALCLSSGACGRDTYLEVQFRNPPRETPIHYIGVRLVWMPPDGGTFELFGEVPDRDNRKTPLKFPATMAFKLDERGTLAIAADAFGQGGVGGPLAHAMKDQIKIMESKTWTVVLDFGGGGSGDGGVPAPDAAAVPEPAATP